MHVFLTFASSHFLNWNLTELLDDLLKRMYGSVNGLLLRLFIFIQLNPNFWSWDMAI